MPLALAETIIFGLLVYFIPAFDMDAGRFFFFLLLLFSISSAMSQTFRLITYLASNADVAHQMNLPFVMLFVVYGGFLIPREQIQNWLIWAYYLSPFSWGTDSLAINEFSASKYSPLDASTGERLGDTYLKAFGLRPGLEWQWYAIIYLWSVQREGNKHAHNSKRVPLRSPSLWLRFPEIYPLTTAARCCSLLLSVCQGLLRHSEFVLRGVARLADTDAANGHEAHCARHAKRQEGAALGRATAAAAHRDIEGCNCEQRVGIGFQRHQRPRRLERPQQGLPECGCCFCCCGPAEASRRRRQVLSEGQLPAVVAALHTGHAGMEGSQVHRLHRTPKDATRAAQPHLGIRRAGAADGADGIVGCRKGQ